MNGKVEAPGTVEDSSWELPRSRPITEEAITRAIEAEGERAAREHAARAAWYDRAHDAVLLMLRDGRVFGAERERIPSLASASRVHLARLRPTEHGASLLIDEPEGGVLRVSVHGLVTRLLEASPDTTARIAAARNGELGGRPRRTG